ncbi:Nicotinamide mononucleotide adenylyltransferase [Trichoderma ghanense]|uniref:Nicotinamide mononucleotide adenylyltransferase n=1 Tax=Trichoderma ghanense TaxID=65468 RepID=A0ABY2GS26_9HYPO
MLNSDATSSSAMRPNPKQLIDFFARSLTSFQSSPDVFRILCTLPHIGREPGSRTPSSRVKRLVVLDSSFNPPTRAHAEMAMSALKWASSTPLEDTETRALWNQGGSSMPPGSVRLMLLLSVNNADKAPKPASFPVRLGMMDGFGHELLKNLDVEGIRPEIDLAVTKMPYFHDKARVIGESGVYSYPAEEGIQEPEQVFLAGFDTVIRIFNPKYYGEGGMKAALGPFFERARLRVTMRTDDEWGGEDEQRAYVG